MDGRNGDGNWINSFALVSYIPEPLSGFLDRLRSDLVRESHAKSHLTLLPPRPLLSPAEDAWEELKAGLQDVQPFRVELEVIKVFPVTQVIYLSVGVGREELERIHRALNVGRLKFQEVFQYHPHVTVAQEMELGSVASAAQTATSRWQEFPHRRDFTVDRVTFVQNTLENRWTDLAGCALDHSNISI